jgi:hypothetical protein
MPFTSSVFQPHITTSIGQLPTITSIIQPTIIITTILTLPPHFSCFTSSPLIIQDPTQPYLTIATHPYFMSSSLMHLPHHPCPTNATPPLLFILPLCLYKVVILPF